MSTPQRLGSLEKLGFALGDAASNLFFQTFAIFLMYYYTDILGLAPAAVGTMFLVTRIIDTLTDPLMGLVADRTSSRWGKFRPYLLWAAVPYGLCGYLVFAAPDLSATGQLLYAYASYSLMMLAYTAINVPYSSLMGVLTPSVDERAVVSSWRFVFAFGAGIVVASTFIPLKDALGGGDEVAGVRTTMLVFGVISAALFLVTFATTRERVAPPPGQVGDLRADLAALRRNRPWIVISLVTVLQLVAIVVRESSIVYYFKYLGSGEAAATPFLLATKVAIIAGIVANVPLMRRFDKRTLLVAYAWFAAACYGSIWLIDPAETVLLHIVNVAGSLAFGPVGVILWAMYGDCADHGEHESGRRTTALVFSSSLFAIKLGLALGGAVPGWLLAAAGFEANATQGEEARRMIALLVTLLPAGIIAAFATLVLAYPLDRARMAAIEAGLAARRAAAGGERP